MQVGTHIALPASCAPVGSAAETIYERFAASCCVVRMEALAQRDGEVFVDSVDASGNRERQTPRGLVVEGVDAAALVDGDGCGIRYVGDGIAIVVEATHAVEEQPVGLSLLDGNYRRAILNHSVCCRKPGGGGCCKLRGRGGDVAVVLFYAVVGRRLAAEGEGDDASVEQLGVIDIRAQGIGASGHVEALHVDAVAGVRLDGCRCAVFQMDGCLLEVRRADSVGCLARAYGIEAEGAEDVPSRHLPAVVVAAESVGHGLVEQICHLMHHFCRAPGTSCSIEEISVVVTRLIAVSILPDESRDVALLTSRRLRWSAEEGIQFVAIGFVASQEGDMVLDVVLHVETVLPRVGFGEVAVDFGRIEGREPDAAHLGAHEACGGVKDVAIVKCALVKLCCYFLVSQFVGNRCDAPVIVAVFQSLRYRLVLLVGIDEALLVEDVDAELFLARALQHSEEQLFHLLVGEGDSLHPGVSYHGNGVIAYHAVRFVAVKFPDRQLAAFAVDAEEGVEEVFGAFLLDDAEERVQGAVGVPQREDGVLLVLLADVHLAVHSAIFAVDVREEAGGDSGVIQGGVERRELLFCLEDGAVGASHAVLSLHLNLVEELVPGCFGACVCLAELLLEVLLAQLVCQFAAEVEARILL